MRKKGFTLIELLAVIAVLAIISLIAVPMTLNIIERARSGAAKSSAIAYMKAVEKYTVTSELHKKVQELKVNETYNCTQNTIIESRNYLPINDIVDVKGYMPTGLEDFVKLGSNYRVSDGLLTLNGYQVEIENGKIKEIIKGEKIRIKSMSLNYTTEIMEKGSTFKLEPIFTPNNASDQRVSYKSSNDSVVTVSETGIVTAVKNGTAKVTVTSKDDQSKKAECNITVITSATAVTIEPTSKEIKIGASVQLTGTIEPGDVTTNALTWTSSNSSVAHVDENGLVTGMGVGSATITAKTANGKEATSTITVKEIEAESVSLNKTSATLELNNTLQLTATINPSNVTNKTLTWTSSNTSVATVTSEGLVTGKVAGTSIITVKTSNNKSTSATITVREPYAGVPVKSYTANETVTYKGISFQVVKDNGDTVTLVTSSDVGTGQYGSNTTFSSSTAYNYVNTTWVNNNSGIKEEINGGGIITDTTTNSKVRLLTKDEVSGKTNGTGNAFWTITSSESDMYYAKPDGTTTYSYVSSSNLASANTVVSPTSTSGRVDDSYTSKETTKCVLFGPSPDGSFNICYRNEKVTKYTRTSTNSKPLGYRPVITVRKK